MDEIKILDAFKAMYCFLNKYYTRTSSDDIGSLLGDLNLSEDNKPMDPAAWEEWIDCINKITKK